MQFPHGAMPDILILVKIRGPYQHTSCCAHVGVNASAELMGRATLRRKNKAEKSYGFHLRCCNDVSEHNTYE